MRSGGSYFYNICCPIDLIFQNSISLKKFLKKTLIFHQKYKIVTKLLLYYEKLSLLHITFIKQTFQIRDSFFLSFVVRITYIPKVIKTSSMYVIHLSEIYSLRRYYI